MTVSTRELVDIALEMAGMDDLPPDSTVNIAGSGLSRIMVGIDIGPAELILARDLDCDGVVAHHPAGGDAVLNFPQVLEKQIEFMIAHGVPECEARNAAAPLIARSKSRAHAANFDRTPTIARHLRMPLLNLHLPLDEYGRQIMVERIDNHLIGLDRAPLVQDAVDALMTVDEFANAQTEIIVPVGARDRALGRIVIVHGAGTNGGARIAEQYFRHGAGTVLYIHCSGDEISQLQASDSGNLIVSGHIASDLIGINAYIDRILERGVEVVRVGGA